MSHIRVARFVLIAVLLAVISATWVQATPSSTPNLEQQVPSDDDAAVALPVPTKPPAGDVAALFLAAQQELYATGNVTAAVELLMASSDKGYPAAHSALGVLYAYGIGVPRDEARAVLHYTFAALGGDVEANVILAHRHEYGIGVVKSCKRAVEYASVAAGAVARRYNQDIRPQASLERLSDTHSAKSDQDASLLEMHHLRAFRGTATSCVFLGYAYMHGLHGAKQDGRRAVEYFERARKLGSDAASGALGQIYAAGMPQAAPPIPQDLTKAQAYFMEGAKKRHAVSFNGLGYLHATGAVAQDKRPNWETAASWFKQSTLEGNSDGTYNFAVLELHGRGTPKDVRSAHDRFAKAAAGGSVLAQFQLGLLAQRGTSFAAADCPTALRRFRLVQERGQWLRRGALAQEFFGQGAYAPALLQYLTLAELGVGTAKHNAAYILKHDYRHDVPLHEWHSATPASGSAETAVAQSATVGLAQAPGVAADGSQDAPSLWTAVANTASRLFGGTASMSRAQAAILHTLVWRAAQEGSADAHLELGDHFHYGIGTAADDTKAAEHYAIASETGNAQASFNLGSLYESGTPHVARDYHLAKRYYDTAVTQNPQATFAVDLALWKLNIRWWLDGGEQALEAKKVEAVDKAEGMNKAPESAPTETSGGVLQALSALNPSVGFGLRLDDLLLGSAALSLAVLLLLRHGAFRGGLR